jgi:starvation-inducible DNA-binding protein
MRARLDLKQLVNRSLWISAFLAVMVRQRVDINDLKSLWFTCWVTENSISLKFRFKELVMSAINIGISEEGRLKIAEGLKRLLADSYTLYLQTHNFHWNVTGMQFRELHLMFEEHYTELAIAVDDIAERIRTLDVAAPGTYKEFARLSSIKEVEGVPASMEMVELLTKGHEQVIKTCREVLKVAQEFDDESTASLVSDRMRIHEKTSWMLRATKK